MVFTAVLDAAALYPFSLRDTLLRLAQAELYVPLWSAQILEEMRRNLVEDHRMSEEKAARIVRLMRESFEEAEVDAAEIERLEPAMANHEKDRHVLAAAVAADSEVIVSFNVGDFPAEACGPVGVEVVHPDDFLFDLFDLDPSLVYRMVAGQAVALSNPPVTFDELLNMLERAGVPRFAAAVRDHAGQAGAVG